MTWYYVANGQQAGPVEDAELAQLVGAGQVVRDTLVWYPGLDTWRPFAEVAPTERCLQCKRLFPEEQVIPLAGGKVCGGCKSLVLQRLREGHSVTPLEGKFAGFWIRVVARMIDGTITSIMSYVFQIPILIVAGAYSAKGPENPALFLSGLALATLLSLGAAGAYEAWFLVKKGATPGKLILGLKVIRARGGPISWKLAIGRFFAHMLGSLTLYIGYLMAAWDEEKRTLHDRMCDTRVVHGS